MEHVLMAPEVERKELMAAGEIGNILFARTLRIIYLMLSMDR